MPFPSFTTPPTPLFPTYTTPSLPFRCRHSSTTSTGSTLSTTSTTSSTTTPPTYLPGHTSHLHCAACATPLAPTTHIISKGFTGRHGRAYLLSPLPSAHPTPAPSHLASPAAKNAALPDLPNTLAARPVTRMLVTGRHVVSDVACAVCGAGVGWKYVEAAEEGQAYKVGKVILETRRVVRGDEWEGEGEEGEVDEAGEGRGKMMGSGKMKGRGEGKEVEFDSEDEDECEDLFLGVWTPQLAARRRRARGA